MNNYLATQENYQKILSQLQNQDIENAISYLNKVLEEHPSAHRFWYLLGVTYYQTDRLTQASVALSKAIKTAPQKVNQYLMIAGHIAFKQQNNKSALKYYQDIPETAALFTEIHPHLIYLTIEESHWGTAFALLKKCPPEHRVGFLNQIESQLAQLEQQKDYKTMIEIYELYASHLPLEPAVMNILGALYIEVSDNENALSWYEKAHIAQPLQTEFANNLGSIYIKLGQYQKAELILEKLQKEHPHYELGLFHLGQCYTYLKKWDNQNKTFLKLINLAPKYSDLIFQFVLDLEARSLYTLTREIILLLTHIGYDSEEFHKTAASIHMHFYDPTAALKSIEKASSFSDDKYKYLWVRGLISPVIFESVKALDLWQKKQGQFIQYWTKKITRIKEDSPAAFKNSVPVFLPLFYMAYTGYDDTSLRKSMGNLLSLFFKKNYVARTPKPSSSKIRIGFVSNRFVPDHVVFKLYMQTILGFHKSNDFEVFCFQLGKETPTHSLKEKVTVIEEQNHQELAQIISDQHIDVLIHMELGTTLETNYLGIQRLAPTQCVMTGFPVTSGLPEIDYFISSQVAEPPNYQDYYTEKVILTQGSSCSKRPVLDENKQFALPEELKNKHIYNCPIALFKIHPEMDVAFLKILEDDPLATLIFFDLPQSKQLSEQLKKRFQTSLSGHDHKIHFIEHQKPAYFWSLLNQSHVILDTFHFCGGTTSRQVLGLGLPLITLPGKFLRGRITYGFYQKMGIQECIAKDPLDFANKAVFYATHPEERLLLSKDISAKSEYLFKDDARIEDFVHQIKNLTKV